MSATTAGTMTHPAAATSYDPARTVAGGIDAEVDRLERQAALSWSEELRVLGELGVLDGAGALLEIGCGPGAVLRRLTDAVPGRPVLGVDHDVRLLPHAASGGVSAGTAEALPLRTGAVGDAVLRYVLQHLAAPEHALAEARRVVRPGGRVTAIEVDAQLWGACEPMVAAGSVNARMAGAQSKAGGDRGIGRRLTRLLRAAGLVDVTLRPFAVTSDGREVAEFGVHVGPDRLVPMVADGRLTLRDLALATAAWERFRTDPDAWIMLLGFVAAGRVPA